METNPSDTLLVEMARELGIDEDTLKNNRFFQLIKGVLPVYIMNLTRKMAPYGGDIKSNATAVTVVNNTIKTENIEVPAGKRWHLFGGKIINPDNVARNVYIELYDENDVKICRLLKFVAAGPGGEAYFPNSEATIDQVGPGAYPFPMSAGWYMQFYFGAGGASAGGTGTVFAVVVELDE